MLLNVVVPLYLHGLICFSCQMSAAALAGVPAAFRADAMSQNLSWTCGFPGGPPPLNFGINIE